MAGTYIAGETKVRPGVYSRYENAEGFSASASAGVVAIAGTAEWGPTNRVVNIRNMSEAEVTFGRNAPITQMIRQALQGGAVSIVAVRVHEEDNFATFALIQQTGEGVTDEVLTLTAKYPGARDFKLTLRDSVIEDLRELIIYDGLTVIEKVTIPAGLGEAAAVKAALADSTYFTVTEIIPGTAALVAENQKAFTVSDTTPVTTGTFEDALLLLRNHYWDVLAIEWDTAPWQELAAVFVDNQFTAGSFPMAVFGHAINASYDIENAVARATSFNDPRIVYVANSATESDTDRQLSGAEIAARVAGQIAGTPSNESLTHSYVSGLSGPSPTIANEDIEMAISGGALVLTTSARGLVWIESGINTLIEPNANQDIGWMKIRRVKTRFELMRRITEVAEVLIGKVSNDDTGRATILAAAQGEINNMIGEGKLSDGTISEDEAQPARGDSFWCIIAVTDLDSIEKVYLNFKFSFAA